MQIFQNISIDMVFKNKSFIQDLIITFLGANILSQSSHSQNVIGSMLAFWCLLDHLSPRRTCFINISFQKIWNHIGNAIMSLWMFQLLMATSNHLLSIDKRNSHLSWEGWIALNSISFSFVCTSQFVPCHVMPSS